jgi:hypothetical protein
MVQHHFSRNEKILLICIIVLFCSAQILGYFLVTRSHAQSQTLAAATPVAVPTTPAASSAYLRDYIAKNGSEAAWKYLVSLKNTSQGVSLHDAAHLIGSKLYDDFGLASMAKCTIDYAFGCYHGALEEYIADKGVDSLPTVVTYCQKNYPKIAITCYHGIGHGLLTYYKYQLQPALTNCDTLLDTNLAPNCYRGVFMEFSNEYSDKVAQNDPLWPCNTVDKVYQEACYGYQMTYLSTLYHNDPVPIEKACLTIGDQTLSSACIQGFGHLIAQRYFASPDQTIPLCSKMQSTDAHNCLVSVAEELVFQGKKASNINTLICSDLSGDSKKECERQTALQESLR